MEQLDNRIPKFGQIFGSPPWEIQKSATRFLEVPLPHFSENSVKKSARLEYQNLQRHSFDGK